MPVPIQLAMSGFWRQDLHGSDGSLVLGCTVVRLGLVIVRISLVLTRKLGGARKDAEYRIDRFRSISRGDEVA